MYSVKCICYVKWFLYPTWIYIIKWNHDTNQTFYVKWICYVKLMKFHSISNHSTFPNFWNFVLFVFCLDFITDLPEMKLLDVANLGKKLANTYFDVSSLFNCKMVKAYKALEIRNETFIILVAKIGSRRKKLKT